jgi:DDB1- and CUL4-associated factor 11
MANGTVTVHSWADGAEDDEGEPLMGANYNARLDMREDYNERRKEARTRDSGRLRSNPVQRRRYGGDEDGDEDW